MRSVFFTIWICLALVPYISYANTALDDSSFYDRKKEGWFWYEIEPAPKPKKKKKPSPPPVPLSAKKVEPVEPKSLGPTPFSADWVRKNLPRYKDAWWDNPTLENARAFAYIQRFAMDRSQLAQQSYELAVQGDPFLDEVSRRPQTTFATHRVDTNAGKKRHALLRNIAQKVGLFFFYEANNELCELQAPIIKMIQDNYGFTVIPISADGSKLAQFPNVKVDKGHAQRLGVMTYPALFLATPSGDFAPVGQGVMSLPDIANRIIGSAYREGWIDEKQFNQTKPLVNTDNNISELLDRSDKDALKNTNQDKNNFIPPAELLDLINSSTGKNHAN